MSEYSIQIGKVQAPPLRDETLERVRLLEWLNVKIHRRVVLVLAEAGYGKTTLLADFSRRTRVRALWFRLDRGDRDWMGFLAYLVAAVRVHVPEFGPVTESMLRETGAAPPPRDAVLDTFIRELGELPADPTAVILDDVHVVDDSIDVRDILRELLARAPERLTFVLISRTTPPVPLARLRALGEVAELRTSDLRFDAQETEALFRDTYALTLEPGVVAELSRRTEGWAASLQLVRTAIRDRSPSEIRAFVGSLSGAEGELYDYLAEEVVGELSAELQQFLMRTALLDVVEPVLGSVAAGTSDAQTRAAIAEGESIGLFSRTGPQARDHVRAHPLVRDFLLARLRRSLGAEAVAEIHRAVAVAAEPLDWRIAGHHYVAAGDLDDARRVLAAAIETILASGAYAAAEELATALPPTAEPDANVLVVLSRRAQQRGDPSVGRDLAERAYEVEPRKPAVVLNLVTARLAAGEVPGALGLLHLLEQVGLPSSITNIARAVRLMIATSIDGNLVSTAAVFEDLVGSLRQQAEVHFVGVALTNLAYVRKGQGRGDLALRAATDAIACLEATSAGPELVAARLVRGWALAHMGNLDSARDEISVAARQAPRGQAIEVAYEAAEVELLYGDPAAAAKWLEPFSTASSDSDAGEQAILVQTHLDLANRRSDDARARVKSLMFGAPRTAVAFEARRRWVAAFALYLGGEAASVTSAAAAHELAAGQGAELWAAPAEVLRASTTSQSLDPVVLRLGERDPALLSVSADLVAPQLGRLAPDALDLLRAEASHRPERWRPPLRWAIESSDDATRAAAGTILDLVGTQEDIAPLRRLAKSLRGRPGTSSLGRGLARRIAPRVRVEDLGRVKVVIGSRLADGSTVRRKVLALLCFLITRPDQSATREEVLDALWPDLAPSTALNSLNQTVYFLRRVFEPDFAEDLTAGYVGQDGETVWLDEELVKARSQACRDLIRRLAGVPSPDCALQLAREYHGKFALDFMYEDWANPYRDSLHAAYLRVVEAALRSDADTGHYLRGIEIAQLAQAAEPESEELQVSLLRLYRLAGSLAAASEQYGHYAQSLRELGIEPPPFGAI